MARPCILVVDDEPIVREILTENLHDADYVVHAASHGAAAWELIEADESRFDAILLDRIMPGMDGIDLLRRIKERPALAYLPVILQTTLGSESDVREGLQAGAYYYLIKPFSGDTLLAIVAAATRDFQGNRALAERVRREPSHLKPLVEGRFAFRTPDEAHELAVLAARLAPDPVRAALGLAELLLNAIEHGNLEIGYAGKSALIEQDALSAEITRRLELPEYRGRMAELHIRREAGALHFVVRDQGQGFAWQDYIEMSPERVFDTHGRGIAMSARMSFEELHYRGCGNEVEATLRCP